MQPLPKSQRPTAKLRVAYTLLEVLLALAAVSRCVCSDRHGD